MLDLELLEKVHVFFLKRLLVVTLFLIQNIGVHTLNLRMAIGEGSVSILPTELSVNPRMLIDEIGGIILHIPNQVR